MTGTDPLHIILHVFGTSFSWLAGLATAVSPVVGVANRPAAIGDFVPAAVVVSSIVVAAACAALALLGRLRLIGYRQASRARAARMEAALLLRDAIISAGRESVAVLNANSTAPLSFAGGNARLNACLRGPEATNVAATLSALLEDGVPFTIAAGSPDGRRYAIRGCPVGGNAAVFLREETLKAEPLLQSDAILEALPFPVWIRGKDLALRWANHAFLAATNTASLERAVQRNVALGEADRDLAKVARGGSEIVDARFYTPVAGQRRALAFSMRSLKNGEIAAVAMDVTDLNSTDTELKERAQMEIDSMDSLSIAVAIFTHDRKLVHCNHAYAQLWELSGTWLDTHPTEDEILERLREARRLPERRDFQSWRRDHLNLFEMTEARAEELWHLASGRSLHMEARRLAQGGLVFTYEDITERLRLESAYNTVIKVQKAMLDALSEAVAVFGPDGRLKTYNAAFARLWLLADNDLAGEPHMNRIADLSAARIGRDQFWEMVRSCVASSEPERGNEWGFVTRADGKELWLALARLPDGSTLLTVREASGRNASRAAAQAAA